MKIHILVEARAAEFRHRGANRPRRLLAGDETQGSCPGYRRKITVVPSGSLAALGR